MSTEININSQFDALLNYLHQHRGFDFSGYKRASLMRRIQKRVQLIGLESFTDYIDYLEVHPAEFDQLFNAILINVTSFFRDPAAWDFLVADVLPQIIATKEESDPIRIWCAGSATGEEAYTLAMIFAEALGTHRFCDCVKIYASDLDEQALAHARRNLQ